MQGRVEIEESDSKFTAGDLILEGDYVNYNITDYLEGTGSIRVIQEVSDSEWSVLPESSAKCSRRRTIPHQNGAEYRYFDCDSIKLSFQRPFEPLPVNATDEELALAEEVGETGEGGVTEEPAPYEALISRRRPNLAYSIVGYHVQQSYDWTTVYDSSLTIGQPEELRMATPYQNGNGNGKEEAIEYELINDRNIKLTMSTYNEVNDGVLELHGDINLVVKSV